VKSEDAILIPAPLGHRLDRCVYWGNRARYGTNVFVNPGDDPSFGKVGVAVDIAAVKLCLLEQHPHAVVFPAKDLGFEWGMAEDPAQKLQRVHLAHCILRDHLGDPDAAYRLHFEFERFIALLPLDKFQLSSRRVTDALRQASRRRSL
jgi:hypothetical protein